MAFDPLGPNSYCPACILNGLCELLQGHVGRCTVAVKHLIPAAAEKLLDHRAQPNPNTRQFDTYSESSCMHVVKWATASSNLPAAKAVLPLTLMSAALPCVQAHSNRVGKYD